MLEAAGGEGWGLAEATSEPAPTNASSRCGARASPEDERPPDSSAYQSKIENEYDEPVVQVARLVMAIGAQTNQKGNHLKDESTPKVENKGCANSSAEVRENRHIDCPRRGAPRP